MNGHEVDVFRGGELGGTDQVSLVFPVGIVNGDDETARPQFLQGLFHGAELGLHG